MVVVSATGITCHAPAVDHPGAVGVAVMNGDGQSGELVKAFTFTTP